MTTEQRINLNFLVRLGKTPSDTLEVLQEVYGDETMSRSRVFEWHKRFKEGREDVEEDCRSGRRPSTSRTADNVERVKQMVRGDCRLTVRMIADELEINRDSVWKIITKIWVCGRSVRRWCRSFWTMTRRSGAWRCVRTFSSISKLLIAFFNARGIVHMEFLPQGQTVNQHVYKEILRRLLRSVHEKRRELWQDNAWLLRQDNAPAHNALSIRQFLVEKRHRAGSSSLLT